MWEVREGDVLDRLREMPDESVQCVVTSPPYWGLRDYGVAGQLGLEASPWEYVERMRAIFAEVRRVLRRDGTLWLNMGDCYATGAGKVGECPGGGTRGEKWVGDRHGHEGKHGYRTEWAGRGGRPRGTRPTGQGGLMDDGRQKRPPIGPMTQANRMPIEGLKPKDLVGMPWRIAFALQVDGWWLRRDIVWSKPNPMPESIEDRPTTSHEYVFLMTRNGARKLWWRARDTGEWSQTPNLKQTIESEDEDGTPIRIPRWKGFDYYYDADAIREPLRSSPSDLRKMTEDLDRMGGRTLTADDPRYKANGKTNIGRKRAVGTKRKENSARRDNDRLPLDENVLVGRNRRSVWEIATIPFKEAHFATFPEKLVEPCILAGTKQGDLVLDPFAGSGTVGVVARKLDRRFVGIELNPEYCEMARRRIGDVAPLLDAATL